MSQSNNDRIEEALAWADSEWTQGMRHVQTLAAALREAQGRIRELEASTIFSPELVSAEDTISSRFKATAKALRGDEPPADEARE